MFWIEITHALRNDHFSPLLNFGTLVLELFLRTLRLNWVSQRGAFSGRLVFLHFVFSYNLFCFSCFLLDLSETEVLKLIWGFEV